MGAAATVGVDPDWQRFLAAVAWHESKWLPHVGLGVQSMLELQGVKLNEGTLGRAEQGAAASAYDRHVQDYGLWANCPHARNHYTFGSGGWFGLLPVFGTFAFRNSPFECMDPRKVFDPLISTIMAVAFAKRLMGYRSFRDSPTWRTLNRGWKSSTLMDGEPAKIANRVDATFNKSLRALGLPTSWGDRRVTPLPPGWSAVETLQRLQPSA